MFKKIYSKFFSLLVKSILTAITISAILTIAIYLTIGREDDAYFIIVDTFLLYTVYSFPLIFIAGFIADVVIKRIIKFFFSNNNFIFWKFLLYTFYAIILGFVLQLIFNNQNPLNLMNLLTSSLIVGFIAFIYYTLANLINRFKNRKKNTL